MDASPVESKATGQKALQCIPLPENIDFRNPWPTRCDMLEGPCACGAWHKIEDLKWRIENQLYARSARLVNAAGAALLSKDSPSPSPHPNVAGADQVTKERAALVKLAEALTCRGDDTHYCPKCDNSLFNAKQIVDNALASPSLLSDSVEKEKEEKTLE